MDGQGLRVLAYSHDGYGLGHLRRNLRIVSGVKRARPDVDALLVTGAKAAAKVVAGSGVEWLQLPSVVKVANGCYEPDGASGTVSEVMRSRASMIADAASAFRPDVVLVDRYPRGVRDELLPAFELLRRERPHVPIILGLRDILDCRETVQEEWQRGSYNDAIRELYCSVLIYGDRAVFDPVAEYQFPKDIAAMTAFTGYLGDDVLARHARELRARYCRPDRRLAICTLGGGRDAYPVAAAFLSAMRVLARRGWDGLLITGPYMSRDDVANLRNHPMAASISIHEIVSDVPSHLAAADAAVCMGGYNTMCEVLSLEVPSVTIPRTVPREEQLMRCERFAARGAVSMLHPRRLAPKRLADAVEAVADTLSAAPRAGFGAVAHRGIEAAATQLSARFPVAVGAA